MEKTSVPGLFLLLLLLTACRINVADMIGEVDSFKVYLYEAGRPVREYAIVKGDERYNKLVLWAKENESGWQMDLATYVPGVLVSGGGIRINFLGSSAILSGPDGQFAKDMNPADYAFLK